MKANITCGACKPDWRTSERRPNHIFKELKSIGHRVEEEPNKITAWLPAQRSTMGTGKDFT
jgi:hypothetical protein